MATRGALSDEVVANVRAHLSVSLLMIAVSLISGAALVWTCLTELSGIAEEQNRLVASGYDIWRVQSASSFEALACEALGDIDGIGEAGSAIDRATYSLQGLPGASVDVVHATPGYLRIVWSLTDSDIPSILVGSEAATKLGIRLGQSLEVASKEDAPVALRVGHVARPTDRVLGANQWLAVAVSPAGRVKECLVESEPGARSAVESYLVAEFSGGATVAALYEADRSGREPVDQLRGRITLWLSTFVTVVISILAVVMQFSRRADWALYRLLGASRTDLIYLVTRETSMTVLAPFGIGAVLVLTIGSLSTYSTFVLIELGSDLCRALLILAALPAVEALIVLSNHHLNWLKGS